MTPFDQGPWPCRCECGVAGFDVLAPADVVIVVDVLSFSTCVEIAVARGVVVFPYPWMDAGAAEFADRHGAQLAGPRSGSGFSLSPATFLDAAAGARCVLPSPNGAALTLRAASTGSVVLSGCLRNAGAVADVARTLGTTFNVCPAGEQWRDGSPRLAEEDWLAAGAILRRLPGARSPQALVAIGAFEQAEGRIAEVVAESGSGRELSARGYARDIELAAAFDVSRHVPRFDGEAFVDARGGALGSSGSEPGA